MDDRTLEREIESLLSAEPSHDFTTRVRQRIAAGPRREARSAGAGFAWAFAAAAAVIAAATLMLRVDRQPVPERLLSARGVEVEAYRAPRPVHASRLRVAAASVRRTPVGRRQAPVRPEPEVIIAPAEAAAWRRLLSGAAAGEVALAFARHAAATGETPASAEGEFAIPPVVIEPLALPREQGVHQ